MWRKKDNFRAYSRSSRYRLIAQSNLRNDNSSTCESEQENDTSTDTSSSCDRNRGEILSSISSSDNQSAVNERSFWNDSTNQGLIQETDGSEEYLFERGDNNIGVGADLSSETDESNTSTQDEASTDSNFSDQSSSEDYSSDEDDELIENSNAPLYPGAPITLGESIISILKLAVRFEITGVLLSYILVLVSNHCIQPNNCVPTIYKLKKFFAKITTPLIRHYYCSVCGSKVTENFCQKCDNRDEINYFLQVPIIPQLEKFYKREEFRANLNYRYERRKENNENYEDIYDGLIYNSLPDDFSGSRNNITFTWNTDGVPIFNSSKISIWPFFLMVNELPYKLRVKKENILISGLWFGAQKPSPNLFMGVFRDELEELYDGVNIQISNNQEHLNLRAMIISGTCDLCAKALFFNVKQFNSIYGCPECKIRTKREQNVQVYPTTEFLELRSTQETRRFAAEAQDLNESIFGVKGPTMLDKIVYNYVESTATDEMHNIFQGVVKKLLSFWFDTDFRACGFSLLPFITIVNSRINNITLLPFIPRLPRKISDYAYWKASELVTFLLVYSLPVLKDLMSVQYFEHHTLLVYAVTLLNLTSISETMVEESARLLKEYVFRFEDLYGLRYMSCNVHLLLHLPDNVRKFGPLWVMSCFPFENLNGVLKSYVHGSRHPALQICSSINLFLSLTQIQNQILRPDSQAFRFCEKLDKSGIARYKTKYINQDTYAVGAVMKPRFVPQKILETLNNDFGDEDFNLSKCDVFCRLLKGGQYYETELYIKRKKTNSTFVKYNYKGEECFGILNYFITLHKCENEECDVSCRTYAVIVRCQLQKAFLCNLVQNHVPNVYTCKKYEHDLKAICVDAIIRICFCFKIQNIEYVVIPTKLNEHVCT